MASFKFPRRDFLKYGSAAIALPYFIPTGVLAADGRPGANDKIAVGIVGLGGRARAVVSESQDIAALRIAAVCDCFAPRCDEFLQKFGKESRWKSYEDFRKMLDKENLDGVMIETTTHARAWLAILAMQAGVDAYIEKPMCLTIAEGRAMVAAARNNGIVTQIGTQQRSMPLNNWASDLVKNGAIGKIRTVIAPNFVGPESWTNEAGQPMPQGGTENWWDLWLNQSELRPYHEKLHYGWSRWSDYDGGGLTFGVTGWGTHSYDQVQRALGTDETGPVEIWLEEEVKDIPSGKFAKDSRLTDDTGTDYHSMAQAVIGPRAKVSMRYENGTVLQLHLDGDRGPGLGAIFVGENGKIEINRDKIASNPKEIVQAEGNPGHNKTPETQNHIENWLECIKTRNRCTADIEYGQRSSTICHLVNIVRAVGRVGEKLGWDPAAERFTNCEEANKMLSRPRRKGYELPEAGCVTCLRRMLSTADPLEIYS